MERKSNRIVLFITGNFVGNNCWDEWRSYFEQRGYTTFAPAWPHKNAPVPVLRSRHPDRNIASLRLEHVVDFFQSIIVELPEKPFLIGHSMGALITQLLTQRELAKASVLIHSVPPQGILSRKWSFYRATWGPLGFLSSAKETFLMSFKQWQYAFTNGMPLQVQRETYERYVIPESKWISRDGLTAAAKVDFKKRHCPLLFIAGTLDNIMPASLNFSNYNRYAHAASIKEFKEFSDRNHFVLGQPNWEQSAEYVIRWLEGLTI